MLCFRTSPDNQVRFRERWRTTLDAHRPNGVAPRLERDRGARHRVLFVEACMLTPDQDSGSLRTWRLLRILWLLKRSALCLRIRAAATERPR